MPEDITGLLDHLDIRRAHIVGYSLGGYLVGRFIASHPDRVLSATFGASSVLSPDVWASRFGTARMLYAADELEKGNAIPILTRPNENRAVGAALAQQARDLVARNDVVALAAVVRTFEALTVTPDEIRALRMPIAVVVGTADVPKERVDGFMGLQPDMKVVFIEGGTHASTTKTPESCPPGLHGQLLRTGTLGDSGERHRLTWRGWWPEPS